MFSKRVLTSVALAFLAIGCSEAKGDGQTLNDGDVTFVKGDVVLGDAEAPIKLVEYASTSCGHCRQFHKTILPQLKTAFINTGKANMVFRDLPTPPANVAAAGGALARCAGADKYYDVLDGLFTNQYEIIQSTRTGGALGELTKVGEANGMTAAEVRACVSSTKVIAEITRTTDLAEDDGVTTTPTLFIDGVRVEAHDMTVEGITRLINAKLGVDASSEPAE